VVIEQKQDEQALEALANKLIHLGFQSYLT